MIFKVLTVFLFFLIYKIKKRAEQGARDFQKEKKKWGEKERDKETVEDKRKNTRILGRVEVDLLYPSTSENKINQDLFIYLNKSNPMQLRRSSRLKNQVSDQQIESADKKITKKRVNKSNSKTKYSEVIADEKVLDGINEAAVVKPSKVLEVGDEIPDLTLLNQDNKEVSLKDVTKKNKILILFAYPRASTPGCTRQVCGFRDNFDELKKHAVVMGVSADSVNAQEKFHTKQQLPYDLLSDPKRQLIGLLGAKKTPTSGIIRSYWIFVDGKLKFKKIKVSPEVSVSEAKEHIVELTKSTEEK